MTNNKLSFEQKLEKKAAGCKMQISKNFLYYMIAPLAILLVAIVLICTVGFNLGTDFTGGSTFKLYVNNNGILENAAQYDLNDKEDYDEVHEKIKTILDKNGIKIVSYRTSSMDIADFKLLNGQAVEVVYRNKTTAEEIENENNSIRGQLLTEFNYGEYENAISTIDARVGHEAFNYSMEIMAAILVGLTLVIIYMLLRKYRGATIMMIMQTALDILLVLAMLLICRPVINLSIGIAFLTAFVLSVLNAFAFLNKTKTGFKTGKFENMKNNEIADLTVKELFVKRTLMYVLFAVITIFFVALAVTGVREIALSILIVLAVTFYTSNFVMPALWSTVFKQKKLDKRP